MRIGILTLPLHTNYGGILQAYALQTALERMGHEVIIYQKEYPTFLLPLWKYPLAYGKRILKKCFVDKQTKIFVEPQKRKEHPIINQHLDSFIKKYIHVCYVKSIRNINVDEVDAIVVGSDQVWRPIHIKNLWNTNIQDMFLAFTSKWHGKKIAYAASFGVDEWELTRRETNDAKRLVKSFNKISVREDSGMELCRKHLNVEAELVLDPTLLLSKDDYIQIISNADVPQSKGTLFYYILDETPEKTEFINRIAQEKGLVPFTSYVDPREKKRPLESRIIPPIEQWIRGFYDASFIVTDSFHGCVFSIIFGKPFVSIGNVERGNSRFLSLFKLFGLENHLIENGNKYQQNCSYEIPDALQQRIAEQKSMSLQFLQDSLK